MYIQTWVILLCDNEGSLRLNQINYLRMQHPIGPVLTDNKVLSKQRVQRTLNYAVSFYQVYILHSAGPFLSFAIHDICKTITLCLGYT